MRTKSFNVGILLIISVLCTAANGYAQQKIEEVNKGAILPVYLETSLKTLPNGIKIWDEEEALKMLDNPKSKVLWVDTRPKSMYDGGTVKGAILLAYNKNEQIDEGLKNETSLLTKESLQAAINKSGAEVVAIFCQGPACHRSYNAALRAVYAWGFDVNKIVWFRAGYPNLLKKVQEDPKLTRKMNRYFQGSVLSQ